LPIRADHNHDLTCRMYEPRGCLEVAISAGANLQRTPRYRIF
jgi:endonuclease/exonuclease/phosphatase family metal-dependent hydrolase